MSCPKTRTHVWVLVERNQKGRIVDLHGVFTSLEAARAAWVEVSNRRDDIDCFKALTAWTWQLDELGDGSEA